ncbi:unnamed protein product [Linum trigynum]|uniref:Uncharacterized protein n=1 Tax=Linum trigynum TaxID=586398 RepID=A0AAV2D685_9ROSI
MSSAKSSNSDQIVTLMAATATARSLPPLLCPLQSNWVEVLPCIPPPTTVQHIFADLTLSTHPPLPLAESDEEQAPTTVVVAEEDKIEESPVHPHTSRKLRLAKASCQGSALSLTTAVTLLISPSFLDLVVIQIILQSRSSVIHGIDAIDVHSKVGLASQYPTMATGEESDKVNFSFDFVE